MLTDLYKFYKTLRESGIFYPDALRVTAQFLHAYTKHGASLMTLAKWAALRFPKHVALVDDHRQVTFQELVTNAELLAANLEQTLNIKANQTLGLLGRNSLDFVEILLACELLGVNIILLPTNFIAENLEHLHTQLDAVICDNDLQDVSKQLCLKTITFSSLSVAETHQRLSKLNGKSNIILLTSGTTGQPKVIRQRPRLSLKTLAALLESLQLKANSKTLLTLPISHGHGLITLVFSLFFGATLYVFSKSYTELFVRCLRENKIDTLVLVPTILYRLLQHQEALRVSKIISGSAPLDAKLATQTLQRFGNVLYNLYGSSEAGLISLASPDNLRSKPGTVGKVLAGVTLMVENNHIHVGKAGRLLNTGDMGYLDEINHLFLLGRNDDLLICGGENVHPRMIEEKVNALAYVQETAVVGVADEEYGQVIHLFVVFNTSAPLAVFRQDLEYLLPKTLRPKQIFVVETLPRTASGKIMKRQLDLAP